MQQQGQFPVERLVKTYDFADINQAFADSHTGTAVRAGAENDLKSKLNRLYVRTRITLRSSFPRRRGIQLTEKLLIMNVCLLDSGPCLRRDKLARE